ncbi:hypothetical protein OSB04_001280 [Centaurea solstitialis]|uniref:Major facilitator superfamily (MFS) profile domain-containing protein n=1 Tax=Centaurea solstitialis TaxID=347529 RepID=A0AA38TSI5_9ASTR|nr:hypothetical protein OSB04_001280 [Centaurea solstitialis]
MNSPAAVNPPVRHSPATVFQNPRRRRSFPNLKSPSSSCCTNSSLTTSNPTSNRIQFQHYESYHRAWRSSSRLLPNPRVSSSDNTHPTVVASSSNEYEEEEEASSEEPSFVEFITSERVKVVAMVALALALCNADRVVMSVAVVPLSQSRGWSQSFAGVVQLLKLDCYRPYDFLGLPSLFARKQDSSFLWGYLISPIAGGTLVDYYGGKVVMACGVALWSTATFLTPWAAESSLWALLSMRALLGVAEGVALPCMNNMIVRWFPQTERSRAVGIAMAGFQLGSAIGLTLSPILMSQGGVGGPFIIFGLSGFLWVLVWLSATSSTPERSPQISKYELEYIQSKRKKSVKVESQMKTAKIIPPFRRLLSKLPTWSLIVANSMHSWGFFVILSWMPIYFKTVSLLDIHCFSLHILMHYVIKLWVFSILQQIYHVDLRQAAWFSAVPWSMMALVGYFAGVFSDKLIQGGMTVTLTRKIMQSIGFIGPGIALIGLIMAKSPVMASAWLTLAVGLKSFSHCGFLVNFQEIAPQYSGVIHGMSNTAGTLAAIIGTVGAGFFVELVGSFQGFLLLTALLYFSAALFWNIFSTGERVNFDEGN